MSMLGIMNSGDVILGISIDGSVVLGRIMGGSGAAGIDGGGTGGGFGGMFGFRVYVPPWLLPPGPLPPEALGPLAPGPLPPPPVIPLLRCRSLLEDPRASTMAFSEAGGYLADGVSISDISAAGTLTVGTPWAVFGEGCSIPETPADERGAIGRFELKSGKPGALGSSILGVFGISLAFGGSCRLMPLSSPRLCTSIIGTGGSSWFGRSRDTAACNIVLCGGNLSSCIPAPLRSEMHLSL